MSPDHSRRRDETDRVNSFGRYGPGALIDLPNLSVVTMGLELLGGGPMRAGRRGPVAGRGATNPRSPGRAAEDAAGRRRGSRIPSPRSPKSACLSDLSRDGCGASGAATWERSTAVSSS